jgi:UDP-N-acetylglucosamine--N-acetylmuramyl-(pentapeptide) pyrophosphoryl-undecaprenol N-acetylglucosamine transferase
MISGGGTGGHVYPALPVVRELAHQLDHEQELLDILWVGSRGGMEEDLVDRAGLKIESISAASVRGKNPLAIGRSLLTLKQGYGESCQIISRFQPDALFVTGGYVCVPVALAAQRADVPVIIYLPDIEPGWAIKFLSRFADKVAVTTPEAQQFFKPGLTVVTGYPVEPDFFSMREQGKAAARQQLGLSEELPVLLVFGGSRGARSINIAVMDHLEEYLQVCQVMHVTGRLDEATVRERQAQLPDDLRTRYHMSAYLHEEKVAAFVAADLIISRAGASVMGELPAAGLPGILVPYPHAGAHQTLNAEYLASRQAAVIVKNAELDEKLKSTVLELLTDWEKLNQMGQASVNLAQPNAARRLAQEIVEIQQW